MTKEQKLRSEARQSANFRGHIMGVWQRMDNTSSSATCKECQMVAYVDLNPPVNGTDISGNAVALHCPVEKD